MHETELCAFAPLRETLFGAKKGTQLKYRASRSDKLATLGFESGQNLGKMNPTLAQKFTFTNSYPMNLIAPILIGLVAAEHLYILWMEMFAWTTKGPKRAFA